MVFMETHLDREFTPVVEAPQLPIRIEQVTRRKTASAQIRQGAIEIVMPRHWRKDYQQKVTRELSQRIQREFERDFDLLATTTSPLVTFDHAKDLQQWVTDLNERTLRVPLKGVRIGHAKYTRLAQMNLRTQMMTVSRHSLTRVPESALTYLIIHELAHLNVPDHSPAFWQQVKQFVPDYKYQRRLMSSTHRIRLYEAELEALQSASGKNPVQATPIRSPGKPPIDPPPVKPTLTQLLLNLFDR